VLCWRPAHARRLCRRHYYAAKKAGDLYRWPRHEVDFIPECDCAEPRFSEGSGSLCLDCQRIHIATAERLLSLPDGVPYSVLSR
jgi:hypothetical protein